MDSKTHVKSKRTTSIVQGATITLHNVSYHVPTKKPGSRWATYDKVILRNINGIFKPGMNAILGPTGSGKSSLLDVIAGRKDPRGLEGTLLIDGLKQPKNFKCMSGYVVQDDIVTGTLTVRENIMFSANLRLPESMTTKDKEKRVEDTIYELGLEKCAETKIGTEFIRGVSGGERKRTTIGMELVIRPSVLFLDEPTTGLDASTSNSVMRLLNSLSHRGRTIIFSIHQPRFSIFRTFDDMMLLSEGRTVYHGCASDALAYFENMGYICEEYNNPPDFLLDVILGDIRPQRNGNITPNPNYGKTITDGNQEVTSFSGVSTVPDVDIETGTGAMGGFEARNDISCHLADHYEKSTLGVEIKDEADQIYKEYQKRVESGTAKQIVIGEYATGFFYQTRIVSKRALQNLFRDPQTAVMQMVLALIMSTITGIIYLQLESNYESGIQNRVGAFFFISQGMVFSSVSAVMIFIAERAIFIHERVGGFYRVPCYFLAKILFDMLPMRLLPTTVYALIAYFLIGFQVDVAKFFIFYLTLLLLTFTAVAIAFFASCISSIFQVANLIAILICILSMVFGGFLVNLDTMGDWLSWLEYLSMFRYALNALFINELKDQNFCTGFLCQSGNDYMTQQGISYETSWDLWQNHLALVGIMTFFIILAYIMLQNINRYK